MSIYGAMFSGVSGLAAQSNALGVISDNISNVNTVGYKGSRATFQTLVTQATTQTTYTPGGVGSRPLQGVDKQGLLQGTSNATDLSISGNGMFVVNESINPDVGDDYMFTRAGEFRPDEEGNLRNSAGFYLQGWPLDENGNLPPAQQSINSVETVNVSNLTGLPRATDQISLGANLPAGAANDANVFETAGGTEQRMTVNMFDALGNAHNMTMKYSLLANNVTSQAVTDPSAGVFLTDPDSFEVNADTAASFDITAADGTTYTVGGASGFDTSATDLPGLVALINTAGGGDLNASINTDNQLEIEHVATPDPGQALQFESTELTSALGLTQNFQTNNWYTRIEAPVRANDPTGGNSGAFSNGAGGYEDALTGTIQFDGDGAISSVPSAFQTIDISWDQAHAANGTDAALTDDLSVDFGTFGGFDGMTQFDSNFAVSEINQNGLKFGNFTGVNVNEEGTVTAVFDNGRRKDIYQLPIAMFSNFNGLQEASGNAYLQTRESGDFLLSEAGIGGAGDIAPSAVEQSTVDLAEEFTRMITTQRAYSASTKVITTSDEMLQELTQTVR
jgi:flagellar hook protein FlgE